MAKVNHCFYQQNGRTMLHHEFHVSDQQMGRCSVSKVRYHALGHILQRIHVTLVIYVTRIKSI